MIRTLTQTQPLTVSVIIPALDPRGDLSDHLRSWAVRQSFDRARLQIIAVTDRITPMLGQYPSPIFRDHDQLLEVPDCDEFDCYVEGAQVAHGDILIFTEGHVSAERRCVEATVRYLTEHPDADGVFFKSKHDNKTVTAKMEERVYERTVRSWLQPRHTERAQVRGFALRRDVYDKIGPFRPELAHFSPSEFAARLYDHGYSIDTCFDAEIVHTNTQSLDECHEHVIDYAQGECRFRASTDPTYCESRFGHLDDWANQNRFRPEQARRFLWAALVTLCRRGTKPSVVRQLLAEIGRQIPPALLGIRWPILVRKVRLALMERIIRSSKISFDMRADSYYDAWKARTSLTRMQYILEHGFSPLGQITGSGDLRIHQISPAAMINSHGLEVRDGEPFRWTEPMFAIGIDPPRDSGDLSFTIKTTNSRSILGVFWNNRWISRKRQMLSPSSLSVTIPESWLKKSQGTLGHQLIVVSRHLPGTGPGHEETRRLGMPLLGIKIARRSENKRNQQPLERIERAA